MYKMIEKKSDVLTKLHVKEAREACDVPGERIKKRSRLEWIVTLLELEKFCRADFAFCLCKEDGKTYRVNGNHSSSVLQECLTNKEMPEFPVDIPLCREYWECDTVADLSDVFDSFDPPLSSRSADDRLGAYKALHADLGPISIKVTKVACRGVNLVRKFQNLPHKPMRTGREIGLLLAAKPIRDFCRWLADFEGEPWNGWSKPGIAAAMYEGWKKDPEVAFVIWNEVMGESNADPMDASRKFTRTMVESYAKKGKAADYFYRKAMTYYKSATKKVTTN